MKTPSQIIRFQLINLNPICGHKKVLLGVCSVSARRLHTGPNFASSKHHPAISNGICSSPVMSIESHYDYSHIPNISPSSGQAGLSGLVISLTTGVERQLTTDIAEHHGSDATGRKNVQTASLASGYAAMSPASEGEREFLATSARAGADRRRLRP